MQMVGILCAQQRCYRSKAGLLSEEILTGETREIGEIYRAQILPQSRHQPALFMKASAANRGFAATTSLSAGVLAAQDLDILFQVCLHAWQLRLPVSPGDCAISRRTVMNNAG